MAHFIVLPVIYIFFFGLVLFLVCMNRRGWQTFLFRGCNLFVAVIPIVHCKTDVATLHQLNCLCLRTTRQNIFGQPNKVFANALAAMAFIENSWQIISGMRSFCKRRSAVQNTLKEIVTTVKYAIEHRNLLSFAEMCIIESIFWPQLHLIFGGWQWTMHIISGLQMKSKWLKPKLNDFLENTQFCSKCDTSFFLWLKLSFLICRSLFGCRRRSRTAKTIKRNGKFKWMVLLWCRWY